MEIILKPVIPAVHVNVFGSIFSNLEEISSSDS
jgi:hypothetical protein